MFESHQGHGCLSIVNVVCCQVEFSVMGQLLIQRVPTECECECVCVCVCVIECDQVQQ